MPLSPALGRAVTLACFAGVGLLLGLLVSRSQRNGIRTEIETPRPALVSNDTLQMADLEARDGMLSQDGEAPDGLLSQDGLEDMERSPAASGLGRETVEGSSPNVGWEEVRPRLTQKALEYFQRDENHFASFLVGPDLDDPALLKRWPSVPDDVDIDALLRLTSDIDERITRQRDDCIVELRASFVGVLERDPEVQVGSAAVERKSGDIWRVSVEEEGWHAVFRVNSENSPVVARKIDELNRLKEDRLRLIFDNAQSLRLTSR